jgi:hypothetical protein
MKECLKSLKKYEKVCLKLFTIWNSILKQPKNLIQKICSHSDAQNSKQNCYGRKEINADLNTT